MLAVSAVFSSLSPTLAFAPSLQQFPGSPALAPVRQPFHPSNIMPLSAAAASPQDVELSSPSKSSSHREEERQAWIDRSMQYYSKVMREERRRALGQLPSDETATTYPSEEHIILAKKHYFALRKIKENKPAHAEHIYRRIIDELLHQEEDDDCDHAKLAVTTLLLALLLQGRRGADAKQTRAVFLHFFRVVRDSNEECACSAKVLQAYALFEMKQGNAFKSLYIVRKAVRLDPTLRPVLQWKQFRDAMRQREERQKVTKHAFMAP